ncbi:MAG TPA: DMT family transporter [Gemmatimonadaceae bacterium]|nr:DMT family transporter [Gemmatimonadaceae bacterium]
MMVVAVGALSLMDACLKGLSRHYPALQVTALRGLTTLPLVMIWVARTGGFGQLLRVRAGLHLARGVLGILALSLFAYGVRYLPLSEAYAIFFVAPILIMVFAALFLRESVGWRRWIAIGGGMLGVVIVLRPSGAAALSLPGLAILVTAVCYALSAITVRILGRTDSTPSMVFWLMAFVALGAGLLAWKGWEPIRSEHMPILLGLAVTGSIGQWALTEAFKLGESSVIAPLEYTALVWGVGLDWVIWQTGPAARTLVGAAVVIASGVYLIRRERVHVEAEHP